MEGHMIMDARSMRAAASLVVTALLLSACDGKSAPSRAAPPPSPAMIEVKGGSFLRGADDSQSYLAEGPVRKIEVGSFAIGAYEVSLAEFQAFVDASGYRTDAERSGGAWIIGDDGLLAFATGASYKAPGFEQGPDEPAVCVSWNDAILYCVWLNEALGLENPYRKEGGAWRCDFLAQGYRLPTEAEWEFAARGGVAGSQGRFAGQGSAEAAGWVLGNSGGRTHARGALQPNPLGLYDTVGNVFEWCWDLFGQGYYAVSPAKDPRGPDAGLTRVARGGSWASRPRNARSTQRYARSPDEPTSFIGFRLAMTVKP
jgi:formylglycine-generating enzyme required for sulfatase activity